MFTGIIEDLGTVESLKPTDQGAVISVHTSLPVTEITIGDSITVNGACLTVISKSAGRFAMDVSAETLRCTGLGDLKPGARVNLERCLTLGKLLGGHLVSGHVDGIGRVVSIKPEGDSKLFAFEVAGLLLDEEQGAIDAALVTLADALDRVGIPDDERLDYLARCVHRAPADAPRWLRSTAALCRLVRTEGEEPGELVERLFALRWAWGALPEAAMSGEAIDDAYVLRQDLETSLSPHQQRSFVLMAPCREELPVSFNGWTNST